MKLVLTPQNGGGQIKAAQMHRGDCTVWGLAEGRARDGMDSGDGEGLFVPRVCTRKMKMGKPSTKRHSSSILCWPRLQLLLHWCVVWGHRAAITMRQMSASHICCKDQVQDDSWEERKRKKINDKYVSNSRTYISHIRHWVGRLSNRRSICI